MANLVFITMQIYGKDSVDVDVFLDGITREDGSINFNSVATIPEMPNPQNPAALKKAIDAMVPIGEYRRIGVSNALRLKALGDEGLVEADKKVEDDLNIYLNNYQNHGAFNRDDWFNENVGAVQSGYGRVQRDGNRATIYFDTKWSAPDGMIKSLIRKNPFISIWGNFSERSMGFYGHWNKRGEFKYSAHS